MHAILGWTFVFVGVILYLAGWVLVGWAIHTLRRLIHKWRCRLPAGVTMEMVLRESPYELAHFQGENGYRIADKRTGEFVDWKDPERAKEWIIRQYLKQRRREQENKTSG